MLFLPFLAKKAADDLGQDGDSSMAKGGAGGSGQGQFKVKTQITGNVKADDVASVLKKQGGGGGAGKQTAGKQGAAGKQRAAG